MSGWNRSFFAGFTVLLVLPGLSLAQSVAKAPAGQDVAMIPPKIITAPGPEYSTSGRMFQGIPGLERAKNGRLWATWYGGGMTEDQNNYVMLATSADDGVTWSDVKMIIDPDGAGPCRAFDPCLWHDPQGRMWLFWAERHLSTQLWAMVTEDSGEESPKWSAPRRIHEGIMMNKPLVTSAGTWLLPVAVWGREGSAMVVASTDKGESFTLLGKANIPEKSDRNCDEHVLVERGDKSLWLLVRTKYGIGESTSTDQGKTWSDARPWAVPHTVARFYIRRLSSGNLLLVKHGPLDKKTGRSHLTAYVSNDDGKTWKGGLMLDERSGVSYPDGVQAPDGSIYIIYDFNRTREEQILMAKFTEADVVAGKIESKVGRLRVLVNQALGRTQPKK